MTPSASSSPASTSPVLLIVDPTNHRVCRLSRGEAARQGAAGQRELKDPRVQQEIREQLRDRREQLLEAAYYEVVHDEAKIENFFAEEF